MNFAKIFKQYRKANGLTQVESAKKLRISQSFLSKLEAGKATPRADVYVMLQKLQKR